MPEPAAPYVLICPSHADGQGRGAVAKQVIRFLNDPDRWVQLRADWASSDSAWLSTVLYGIGATRDFRNAETYI